jgi:Ulp1 protease family, C-terminal catalytic domain
METLRHLSDYVIEEAREKYSTVVHPEQIQGVPVDEIPEQHNSWDCGLFLLQYVEQFLYDPVEFIRKIAESEMTPENFWNDSNWNAEAKRGEIRNLIFDLHEEMIEEDPQSPKKEGGKNGSDDSIMEVRPTAVSVTTKNPNGDRKPKRQPTPQPAPNPTSLPKPVFIPYPSTKKGSPSKLPRPVRPTRKLPKRETEVIELLSSPSVESGDDELSLDLPKDPPTKKGKTDLTTPDEPRKKIKEVQIPSSPPAKPEAGDDKEPQPEPTKKRKVVSPTPEPPKKKPRVIKTIPSYPPAKSEPDDDNDDDNDDEPPKPPTKDNPTKKRKIVSPTPEPPKKKPRVIKTIPSSPPVKPEPDDDNDDNEPPKPPTKDNPNRKRKASPTPPEPPRKRPKTINPPTRRPKTKVPAPIRRPPTGLPGLPQPSSTRPRLNAAGERAREACLYCGTCCAGKQVRKRQDHNKRNRETHLEVVWTAWLFSEEREALKRGVGVGMEGVEVSSEQKGDPREGGLKKGGGGEEAEVEEKEEEGDRSDTPTIHVSPPKTRDRAKRRKNGKGGAKKPDAAPRRRGLSAYRLKTPIAYPQSSIGQGRRGIKTTPPLKQRPREERIRVNGGMRKEE